MSWAAVAAVAKTALNNRILTRRLKSKQHEEISKAEPSPLSHAFESTVQKMSDESPFVQAEQRSKARERHWLPLCLFIQPRDGDWTNSPFPLKLDQTGVCRVGEGCCPKWREEREDLSWERALRSKPGAGKPSREIGAGSWPPTKALFPQLSASSSSTPPTLPLRQSWTSVLQARTFWAIQMNESNREGQHQASYHAWPLDWCSCGEFPDHFRLQWRFIICCTV